MLQIYNYMIESYLPKQTVRNHAHKRTELRKVYESIVRLNKNTGFYKIDLSKENQAFTFGIKDAALALTSRLVELTDCEADSFMQKTVSNSDRDVLTANLVDEDIHRLPEELTLTVEALATPQINQGKDLFHSSRGLERGEYPFRAIVMNEVYELTFLQQERTSNYITMKNMTDYINENLPGITVTMETGENKEYSRLILKADFTGKTGDRGFIFEGPGYFDEGVVDFFGLNRIQKVAGNAKFTINGIEKQTTSNTFHIENALEVTLHDTSEKSVVLGIIPDSRPILSQVDAVLLIYNDLIHIVKRRKEETREYYNANKLVNELKGIEKMYREELSACGLKMEEDGTLTRNEKLSEQAAVTGRMKDFFDKKDGFIAKLLDKAEGIAINPLNYLDKVTVTYPNNSKGTYSNPYVTSVYSGLFFSSYC